MVQEYKLGDGIYLIENYQKLYSFVNKWLAKFSGSNAEEQDFIGKSFAIECEELGFNMDCGESFNKLYPNAINKVEILEKIIKKIKDICFLGTAIYSKWWYLNNFACDSREVFELHNREWFIVALSHMKKLINGVKRYGVVAPNIVTLYGVRLDSIKKSFFYFGEKNRYKIFDNVIVPFGNENKITTGVVISITRIFLWKIDIPLESIKFIRAKMHIVPKK